MHQHTTLLDVADDSAKTWRVSETNLAPLAQFIAASRRALSDLQHGRDPNDALEEAYELAADIRNMSKDPAWKEPPSQFRSAFLRHRCGELSAADLAQLAAAVPSQLPASAILEPLDYLPTPKASPN